MGLSIGIVGLPNVGKSTLFNALSGASVLAANYPFATKDPNVGVVPVPDERLDRLAALYKPKKTTHAALEFLDIAGLVRGASKGEGLGNQFLANIREVDAIAHVVRCFNDPDVVHVDGAVDPERDKEVVETELQLKDLESLEKKRERRAKEAKAPGKPGEEAKADLVVYDKLRAALEAGRPAGSGGPDEEEKARRRGRVACPSMTRRSPARASCSCSPASRCSMSPTWTSHSFRAWTRIPWWRRCGRSRPARARGWWPSAARWRPRSNSFRRTSGRTSSTPSASPSPAWPSWCAKASRCLACRATSPPARTSAGPGW